MSLEAAGLRLAADIGLATILGDSEDGLSITEIAEKTGVDALKLGKYLSRRCYVCVPDTPPGIRTSSALADNSRLVPRALSWLFCE